MIKQRKMDPNFVSNQKWEIQYVSDKIKKEGHAVTPEIVRATKKLVGRSRRKIYSYLRINY